VRSKKTKIEPFTIQKVIRIAQKNSKQPLQYLIYNNFDPTAGSMIIFIFERESRFPTLVLKLSKEWETIKKEYQNMKKLYDKIDLFIPEPLFFQQMASVGVLGMKAISGKPVKNLENRFDLIDLVLKKMITLHETCLLGKLRKDSLIRSIDEALQSVYNIDDGLRIYRFYQKKTESLLNNFNVGDLPKIPQHGDFYANNILFQSNKLFLLDWEDFGETVVPAYDFYCFFLNLYGNKRNVFLEKPPGKNKIRNIVQNNLIKYLKTFNIPVECSELLFIFTLLAQFNHSYRLGRTSRELLWSRLTDYAQNPEKYDLMFTTNYNALN
jgi:hypothetical protein